jgi:hypothetical protein
VTPATATATTGGGGGGDGSSGVLDRLGLPEWIPFVGAGAVAAVAVVAGLVKLLTEGDEPDEAGADALTWGDEMPETTDDEPAAAVGESQSDSDASEADTAGETESGRGPE